MIILFAVALIVVFVVAGLRTLDRENRKERREPGPDHFSDDPDPPAEARR